MAPRDIELEASGPFRAEQIPEGSRFELSNGHPIYRQPSGQRGGRSKLLGGQVLETDPAVVAAGINVGFSPKASELRAPHVSVGNFANEPGWAPGAPLLALEYADTDQDEAELRRKITDLLTAGTKHVWVARLVGAPRVDVYEPGKDMRLAGLGEDLVAPGVLKNPVPVLALFDRDAAHEAMLRNLLQRKGYESLDEVREEEAARGRQEGEARAQREGEARGRQEALLGLLAARGLRVPRKAEARIRAESDTATLDRWIARTVTVASVDELTREGRPKVAQKKAARVKR